MEVEQRSTTMEMECEDESGTTPRSCSMGDLTSSATSLNGGANGQGHHHHHGKPIEQLGMNTAPVNGLQSSTVPLVTSLPLPPATSVTYEFSLAPVSGTLAPGWHLTAVQRGLATAVPLAAAVARRRLPRPRTARPRFGFTDKNEARRAKWTIVVTALALLAMSMLLVGITLRLAPLIDDLGSSSSASFRNRISFRRDPLSRRASGDAVGETSRSYGALPSLRAKKKFGQNDCSEPGMEHNGHNNLGQSELNSLHSSANGSGQNLSFSLAPHLLERKLLSGGSIRSRGYEGEVDTNGMKRQVSMTLSIPSREDSVRSHTSTKSCGSYSTAAAMPIAAAALASFCTGSQLGEGRVMIPSSMGKPVRYGSNPDVFPARRAKLQEQELLYQSINAKRASSKSQVAGGGELSRNGSGKSNNLAPTLPGAVVGDKKKRRKAITAKEKKRNEKVAWAIHLSFSFLLVLAITCIIASVRISSLYNSSVRKENENLLQSIQPQLNLHNATTPQPSIQTQLAQDNSNGNGGDDDGEGHNDKSISSLQSGQSLQSSSLLASSSNIITDGNREDEEHHHHQQSASSSSSSNNETTHHKNLELVKRAEGDEISGGGSSRSNNQSSSSSSSSLINNDSTNSNNNPSLKSNSVRPKRSRPRRRLEEVEEEEGQQPPRTSNIIISVLNGKAHANSGTDGDEDEVNDKGSPPGLTKTRHLERSFIRFLKNSNGQGMRERRNLLEEGSRKL